jgi:hypothetical protein
LTSTGYTQTFIGNKGSIQIRFRYCDRTLSEQRLLQAMYDFTISAYFRSGNWNPYGEPNAPDASLGKAGEPLYPVAATGFATVSPPRARQEPTRPTRQHAPASRAGAAAAKAEPTGPAVPAPPVSGTPADAAGPRDGAQPAGRGKAPVVIVPPPPCDPAGGTCR